MREIFITSSVLILAILLIRAVVKGRVNPCIQYALWLLVVMRLLLPVPLWSSRFSVMNLFPEVLSDGADKLSVDDENSNIMGENVGVDEYAVTDIDDRVGADNGSELGKGSADKTYGEANIVNDVARYNDSALSDVSDANNKEIDHKFNTKNSAVIAVFKTIIALFPFIWAAGVIATGGYMLFYHIKWKRYLYSNRKLYDGLDETGRYRGTLSIYTVDFLPSPCLSGRSIYLTKKMAEDKEELGHILAHEYCHYRQLDSVWVVVRCVLTAVYWFNPLVWVAAYASKQDSELACDEAVIQLLGEEERLAYGRTLVRLASDFSNSKYFVGIASTMNSGEKGIKERIGMIAGKHKYIAGAVAAVLIIAGGLVAVTFSGAGRGSDDLTITYLPETVEENNETDADVSGTANADERSEAQEEVNGSESREEGKWKKVVVKDVDGSEYEGWVSVEEEGVLYYSNDGGKTYKFITDDETKVVNFEILKDNEPDGVNFDVLTSDAGSSYNIVTDSEDGDVYIITDSASGTMTYYRAQTLETDGEKMQKLKELEAEIAALEEEITAKAEAIKDAEAQMKAVEEETKQIKEMKEQSKTAEEQKKAVEVQRQADAMQKKSAEIQKLILEMETTCSMLESEKIALEAEIKAAEDALKAPSLNLLCYGYFSSGNEKISYVNPCPEYTRISNDYGSRIHPMTGIERMHYGVDLAAAKGADIVAAADGVVQDTGFDTSNGNYVILCHLSNGEFTYYTHCGDILVKKGDNVTAGGKIAEVGVTGDSTGAHLHFAVSRNGEYIEPVFEMD
ncbi:MAG: peptidoglycan DD-metalloendopeptidase family protein [Lachnospiraceae bacterium]|nr:peptidoglycan DD-metalloendopeptidase family protein [Lachnospiraceae bacterium]